MKDEEPLPENAPQEIHTQKLSPDISIDLLIKLADSGQAAAQFNLALAYYKGLGVPQNFTEAAKWFTKAASQGYAKAQGMLGIMHEKGEGVTRDYKEAAKWYKKNAESGDSWAQFFLGTMYYEGQGVPQDYTEAIYWQTKAAEQGRGDAQFNLGLIYSRGEVVPLDYGLAIKWFTKAAEQGNADAQFQLGAIYYKGEHVAQNFTEAARWFNLAARQDNSQAKFILGLMYESGQGVEMDSSKAKWWFIGAADLGNEGAKARLVEIKEQEEKWDKRWEHLRRIAKGYWKVVVGILSLSIGMTVFSNYHEQSLDGGYFFAWFFLLVGISLVAKPTLRYFFSVRHGNKRDIYSRWLIPIGIILGAWGITILNIYDLDEPLIFMGWLFIFTGGALTYRPILHVLFTIWRESAHPGAEE